MRIVSPDIPDRRGRRRDVGVKTAANAEKNTEDHSGERQKYKAADQDRRNPGYSRCGTAGRTRKVIFGSITDGSFCKGLWPSALGVLCWWKVLKDSLPLAPAPRTDALSMLEGIQAHEHAEGQCAAATRSREALAMSSSRGVAARQRLPEISTRSQSVGNRHKERRRSQPERAHRRRLRLQAASGAAVDRRKSSPR